MPSLLFSWALSTAVLHLDLRPDEICDPVILIPGPERGESTFLASRPFAEDEGYIYVYSCYQSLILHQTYS
jgi:hypothetical protein